MLVMTRQRYALVLRTLSKDRSTMNHRLLAVMVVVISIGAANDHLVFAALPNVILIVVDDLGYGELGCYGGQDIPTPHIDALAAAGVRFTNGYVTAPFCAASRAGLLTGRYQTRFGFEFNPIGAANSDPRIGLPPSERTIADQLRAAGYATALIGKWHLGGTAVYHPQRRGFDEFFGFLHEGHYYAPPPFDGHVTWLRRTALPDGGTGRWTSPDGRRIWSTHMGHREPDYDADNPVLRGSQPVDERENLTVAFTREAIDFIARHAQQPFFLCLSYNAVHSPLQATDADLQRFAQIPDVQRRIFAAMLAQLDDCIGRVRQRVVDCGIESQTLLVLLSDNGGPTQELTSSNAPLRGGKGELYEGGIRVPMMLSWKGTVPAAQSIDLPVSTLDLAATLSAVSGAKTSASTDGMSLLPLVLGKTGPTAPRPLFWRVGTRHAVRHDQWKLIRNTRTSPAWELYDLPHDLGETTDLALRQPARVRELSALWDKWNAEQREPLWP
jgi:arylsulfatase A-like enzyme